MLAEDKFGHEFNSKIGERVEEMNAAQLQGIYNHLLQTSRGANTKLWKGVNKELIGHVEGLMRERVGEVDKARAKKEEENAKLDAREKLKEMRRNENANMLIAVQESAHTQAVEEITAKESMRKREERTELVYKNTNLEEERDKFFVRIGVAYVLSSIIVIALMVQDFMVSALGGAEGAVIGGWMGISTLGTAYLCYRKFITSVIYPKVVTEEELEEMIEDREEEIRAETLRKMAEEKRLFKLAMKKEKEERRERRRLAKEKAEYEAQLLADLAEQQAAAAAEVFGEEFSQTGTSIATGDAAAEGKEERKEGEYDDDDDGEEEDEEEEEEQGSEEEEEDEEESPILGLPWASSEGTNQKYLRVSLSHFAVSLRGEPKFSALRAQASTEAAGAGGAEAKVLWRGTGEKLKPKSQKSKKLKKADGDGDNTGAGTGAGTDADAKQSPANEASRYQFTTPKDSAKAIFALDSRTRVRLLVQALEGPSDPAKADDVEAAPAGEYGDLGMFEFSLTDAVDAWTAATRAKDAGAGAKGGGGEGERETTIKLEGLFVSSEYEAIGKAGAVLQLEQEQEQGES